MFVKRLGEKLKNEKIRVFSIDPGGMTLFFLQLKGYS